MSQLLQFMVRQWFYPAILVFRARQECQVRLVRQAANPWHSREIDSYNESSGTTANGMSSSKDDKVDQTESTNRSKRAGGSRGSHTHQKVVPTSINAVSLSTEEREPDMAGILQSSDVAVVSKVNPYASVCSCGICAVFVIVWSLLSVGFGIHHLFTVCPRCAGPSCAQNVGVETPTDQSYMWLFRPHPRQTRGQPTYVLYTARMHLCSRFISVCYTCTQAIILQAISNIFDLKALHHNKLPTISLPHHAQGGQGCKKDT